MQYALFLIKLVFLILVKKVAFAELRDYGVITTICDTTDFGTFDLVTIGTVQMRALFGHAQRKIPNRHLMLRIAQDSA